MMTFDREGVLPPLPQVEIDKKRRQRMSQVDEMPSDIRELVHEYGLNIVKSFLQCGVTKPRRIKHLVETVLDEFSPTRSSFSNQGPAKDVRKTQWGPKP